MTTESMTVHQALCDAKVSAKKIEKVIGNLSAVAVRKQNGSKVHGMDEQSFSDEAKKGFQSAQDLLRRHLALKRAINQYNAKTVINVAGTDYTVAQALYMMQYGLDEKKRLIQHLTKQLANAEKDMAKANGTALDEAAERNAQIQFGNEKSTKSSKDYLEFITNYKEQNQMVMVDPLGIRKVIDTLQGEVDEFESKVDAAIQVANATNTVTIEY